MLLTAALYCGRSAYAALRLGAPFGDHMVLPRDVPVTIWGSGAPGGDTVRIHFAGQTATAHSDWQGRWQVTLAPMKAGGPYQMNVEVGGTGPFVPSSAANSTGGAELNDVLVGDVITVANAKQAATDRPAQPDIAPRASIAQPYAFVRVYRPRTETIEAHWTFAWQGHAPHDAAALYDAGSARSHAAGVPVGVIETALPLQCPPSTSCSAH